MELKSPLKLSLIFILVAAPTAVALAQTNPNCPICNFNGFSVGVGLGATTFMTDPKANADVIGNHTLTIIPPLPTPPTLIPSPPTFGNQITNSVSTKNYRYGGMGALYVGWGYVNQATNYIYFGAELGINVLGATHTNLN